MSGISTHILDTAAGKPGTGVTVQLERMDKAGVWQVLSKQETDGDGRCRQLLPADVTLEPGQYRIRFETGAYYAAQSLQGLYPFVEITFAVREADVPMHIPLLLTANGYTTYRGT